MRFSQRGGAQISTSIVGVNATYDTSNGTYGGGYTHNVAEGVTLGANWNSRSGVSVTGGINRGGSGISLTVNRNGTSASAQAGGTSFGTNGPNGFTPAEMDWVDQNLAQGRENADIEKAARVKANEENYLKSKGMKAKDIAKLTPEARAALIHKIASAEDNNPETNLGAGTTRDTASARFLGRVTDGFSNMGNLLTGRAVSSDTMLVDADGKIHPRTCFVAGTKVHTIDGLKNIEEINVGDVVLSKSDKTGEVAYKKVINTFIRQADAIYAVKFVDGTILETTWNHPFRRQKSNQTGDQFLMKNSEWIEAKDLVKGDLIHSANGDLLAVDSVKIDKRNETVYNFEVEDFHTYFVGEAGVWVHNLGCVMPPITGANIFDLSITKSITDNAILLLREIVASPCGSDVSCTAFPGSKIIQAGGHTLSKATLKVLKLTKQEGKIAMERMKKANNLGNADHGSIRGNGDVLEKKTGEVIDNLRDYLP